MVVIDTNATQNIEQYMEIIRQIDQLLADSQAGMEAITDPDQHKKAVDKIEDLNAIRKQLVDHVKEKELTGKFWIPPDV